MVFCKHLSKLLYHGLSPGSCIGDTVERENASGGK